MPGSRLLVNRVGIMEPMDGECKRQWLLCISNVSLNVDQSCTV